MKLPADVRALLAKRFAGKRREWLAAGDSAQPWPLVVPLGVPGEAEALRQVEAVRMWAAAWREWRGEGDLQWVERRWRMLGTQRLPASLRLDGPRAVCAWIGETQRWELAERRHLVLAGRWPALAPAISRMFDVLADMAEGDFSRVLAVLEWFEANPASGLYPRQLPIPGIDTKWLEARKGLLAKLLAGRSGSPGQAEDFHALCGLRPLPAMVHLRVLDPAMRAALHGLRDVCAPVEQLAGMAFTPSTVLVVENLQTGLALPDMPGAVAFVALGYRVDILGEIPWIRQCRGLYWGDIDTHGFAILHRARHHLPQLRSVLMDESTLHRFASLWSVEASQSAAERLPLLHPAEMAVYQGLREQRWGHCIRLEQERIFWPHALQALLHAAGN